MRRTAISFGHWASLRNGVISSDSSSNRTAQSPVRWIISVTGFGCSAPISKRHRM